MHTVAPVCMPTLILSGSRRNLQFEQHVSINLTTNRTQSKSKLYLKVEKPKKKKQTEKNIKLNKNDFKLI